MIKKIAIAILTFELCFLFYILFSLSPEHNYWEDDLFGAGLALNIFLIIVFSLDKLIQDE